MTHTNNKTADVKAVIDNLIHTATNYDVDALERIYHDDLHIIMVDTNDTINFADKSGFKDLFASKGKAGDPPMNTWAKYHHVEVNDDKATVLLSRKNDLSGVNMDLFLTIDLIHEDDRWQVLREVIFLRPETA